MSEKTTKIFCIALFVGKASMKLENLLQVQRFICDECVELCMDIIKEENKSSIISKHQDGVPSPKEIVF